MIQIEGQIDGILHFLAVQLGNPNDEYSFIPEAKTEEDVGYYLVV